MGPLFFLQTLGLVSLLVGILLISLVTFSFMPMRTETDNLSFEFLTGGVFSAITNNYDSRLASAALTAANSGINDGQGLSTGQSSGAPAPAPAPAVVDTVRIFIILTCAPSNLLFILKLSSLKVAFRRPGPLELRFFWSAPQ